VDYHAYRQKLHEINVHSLVGLGYRLQEGGRKSAVYKSFVLFDLWLMTPADVA